MSVLPENLVEKHNILRLLYRTKPKIAALIDSLATYSKKEIAKKIKPDKLATEKIQDCAKEFWLIGEVFFVLKSSASADLYDPDKMKVTLIPDTKKRKFEAETSPGVFSALDNCIHLARFLTKIETRGSSIIQDKDGTIGRFDKDQFIETFLENVKL